MHGLKIQADDYLQKPFNSQELEIRVQNLIENRKKLRKRFAERHVFKAAEIAENPQEELFLQQLTEGVEAHINDLQFDVNELCKLIGMSKSQLNRKMKAVLNKSPNQFIRSYRLERAHQLIKVGQHTISEIAYDVGFSSPAYFSKCFHDEFGYPPSALTEQS
jgi:AraC-like DNA-binding protein